jgi:hypothetical protein
MRTKLVLSKKAAGTWEPTDQLVSAKEAVRDFNTRAELARQQAQATQQALAGRAAAANQRNASRRESGAERRVTRPPAKVRKLVLKAGKPRRVVQKVQATQQMQAASWMPERKNLDGTEHRGPRVVAGQITPQLDRRKAVSSGSILRPARSHAGAQVAQGSGMHRGGRTSIWDRQQGAAQQPSRFASAATASRKRARTDAHGIRCSCCTVEDCAGECCPHCSGLQLPEGEKCRNHRCPAEDYHRRKKDMQKMQQQQQQQQQGATQQLIHQADGAPFQVHQPRHTRPTSDAATVRTLPKARNPEQPQRGVQPQQQTVSGNGDVVQLPKPARSSFGLGSSSDNKKGDSVCENAKSGLSKCHGTGELIPKHELRIGIMGEPPPPHALAGREMPWR